MSENNYKEWAPGLVALYRANGLGSGALDLAIRTAGNARQWVAKNGRWHSEGSDDWDAFAWFWPEEPVWVGPRESYREMRDAAVDPADLWRIVCGTIETPKAAPNRADSTVMIFGEEYVKASDSREALAQAEATIETLRQEVLRACVAAERFGIYQSRADVAAESLASKLVDLRTEFEAYKRRTADSRLQVQRAKAAMNALQGERDLYRDDLDAIRSVLGEPGGSVDLCADKIRAYQEEIDALRAEIEACERAPGAARCLADIEPGIYVSANGDVWRSERKGTIRYNLSTKGHLWTASDDYDPVRANAPLIRIG